MKIAVICRIVAVSVAMALLTVCASNGLAQTTPPTTPPNESEPANPKDKSPTTARQTEPQSDEDSAQQDANPKPYTIEVADGGLQFTVDGSWKNVPPKSTMLEAEIQIPKVADDGQDGRLTIMGAGGTIEANIVRWQDQFTQPDGSATQAKTEQKKIADQSVSLVDISGTFLDSPGGPFSGEPKVERENYRMLAAIVQTKDQGNYFVKFYGPKATIDKNEKAFKEMIESLKIVE